MLQDGLYTVISHNKNEVEIRLSDKNHSVFKAHFQNNPILPAFIHLEIISEIFKIKITAVKKAKFSEIISPNETLLYIRKENKIRVISQQIEVASFIL